MKNAMTARKINGASLITGLLLLIAAALSLLCWSGQKQVWFCDEIYTYESSNGFEQDWPASCTAQWMTGRDVEAFFAADRDTLSLNDITVRLYNDHVPLYFWLFRMVSFFFFRGSGTIWIGLSLNLVFYLIFLLLGYRLFLRLTESPALSGVVMFLTCVVNRLMIEQITILRMYMMLLLAEGMLLLAGFQILREREKEHLSPGVFLCLFIVSVFGFLTHYDYWIFYAATAATFCLWLLIAAVRKKGKRFWSSREFRCVLLWAADFIGALLTTIWLFPYCRWNLNRGKGQTALLSLFDFSGEKLRQIAWGYRSLSASLFGNAFPAAAGLLLVFGCIAGGIILLYRREEYEKAAGLFLTVLAAQIYQLIVCFTMPAGLEERYLWGEYVIMMLCMALGAVLLLKRCFFAVKDEKKQRIIRWITAALLSVVILFGELSIIDGGRGVAYLFHEKKEMNLLKENSDIPWIVYGAGTDAYSYYDWLIPEQICFLTLDNTADEAAAVQRLRDKPFLLYVYEDHLPASLEFFERSLGRTLKAEYLTQSTNFSVYLVR